MVYILYNLMADLHIATPRAHLCHVQPQRISISTFSSVTNLIYSVFDHSRSLSMQPQNQCCQRAKSNDILKCREQRILWKFSSIEISWVCTYTSMFVRWFSTLIMVVNSRVYTRTYRSRSYISWIMISTKI